MNFYLDLNEHFKRIDFTTTLIERISLGKIFNTHIHDSFCIDHIALNYFSTKVAYKFYNDLFSKYYLLYGNLDDDELSHINYITCTIMDSVKEI